VSDARRQDSDRRHSVGDDQLLLDLSLVDAQLGIAQLALDGHHQPSQVSLEQKVVHARPHGCDRDVLSDGSRDDDERQVEVQLAHEREGLRTAEAGDRVVRDDHVPPFFGQRGVHLGGGLDPPRDGTVAPALELPDDQLYVVRIVLDQQGAELPAGRRRGYLPRLPGDLRDVPALRGRVRQVQEVALRETRRTIDLDGR